MTEALEPSGVTETPAPTPEAAVAPGWESRSRPAVAASARPRDGWLIVGGAVTLGLLVMFWLGARRSAEAATATSSPRSSSAYVTAPATPAEVASFATSAPSSNAPMAQAAPAAATPPAAVLTPASYASGPSAAEAAAAARLKAPALVVDLGDQAPSSQAAPPATSGSGPGSTATAGSPSSSAGLNSDEQFAHRVGGEAPDRAMATRIENLRETIPQGAMIPGVMETALDSDLPGYARAVVSRDVRGFDGSAVLIPRGMRASPAR
jgi:type IV secretion system protein VirB10